MAGSVHLRSKSFNKQLKVPSVNQDVIIQSFHCLWNVAEKVIGLSRLNVHETGCCVVLRHVLVCPGKDRGFGIGSPQPGIAYGDRDKILRTRVFDLADHLLLHVMGVFLRLH